MKKRSIQQEIDAKGKAKLEFLLSKWIVNEQTNDFGIDYEVRITEKLDLKNNKVSPISFYIQLKSTNDEKKEKYDDFSIEDLTFFAAQPLPVVFFRYYDGNEKIHWEIFQDYIFNVLETANLSWRNGKFHRIHASNELNDLGELKDKVVFVQKQIYRRALLSLKICEGINFTKDKLNELANYKKRNIEEIAEISLFEALIHQKKGNLEKACELILDIYKSNIRDERKIKAIISLLDFLKITEKKDAQRYMELIHEGKDIALEIKKPEYSHYLQIRELEIHIYQLVQRQSQIKLSLAIQEHNKEDVFSYFFNEELSVLINELLVSETKITESLTFLFDNNSILYFLSLSTILSIMTVKLMFSSAFENEILPSELKIKDQFLSQFDIIFKLDISDEIKIGILVKLSRYYYQANQPDNALKTLDLLISLSKETSDNYSLDFAIQLKSDIQSEPNINNLKRKQSLFPKKQMKEYTPKEYRDYVKATIELQGYDLNSEDTTTHNIRIALDDLDRTSYYQHCEYLHIGQISTSPLGKSIGLESMGLKTIWCKYGKSFFQALSLKKIFSDFQTENCKKCKHHKPRKDDYEFTVEWVQNYETDPAFQDFLQKIRA